MRSSFKHSQVLCSLIGLILIAQDATPARAEPAPAPGLDLEQPTGYFEPNSLRDKFSRRITFDQYLTYGLRSISLVAGFDNDLHRYDNQLDLINSFERNLSYSDELGSLRAHIDSSEMELLRNASELTLIENELNQETCARQLDFMHDELIKLFRDYESFTQSKQLDLIDFIDSFGAAPSEQLLMGNSLWLGSFDQCQQAQIDQNAGLPDRGPQRRRPAAPIRGRYCVAHLRLPSWSRARQANKITLGSESIKLGVCLPRACNSISILRHANRIEALIRLARLQQVPYSSLRLTQLYCLPDENSPLRQFSPSARLFIGLVSGWLLLVLFASLKYELARARLQTQGQNPDEASRDSKFVRVFAFRYACQRLFSEPEGPAPEVEVKTTSSHLSGNLLRTCSGQAKETKSAIVMRMQAQIEGSTRGQAEKQPAASVICLERQAPGVLPSSGLNLAAIDGIKVISMIWLISAHTLLFFIRAIANGRQFWAILLDARFMTIMAGIFPVDSFFTVTGVLTSFLKFNKSRRQKRSLLTCSYWLEIFVHRYLRFMPMYLLVFWYTRDLSEFIGHGPMWDYATANTSLRSICKRESLWVPVLFQANFKPIEQHCVKPAWYLANDYQYLLVTPLFMLLLVASKWLGYFAIGLSVLLSLTMQFLTVYLQQQQPQEQAAWWWWWSWLPAFGSSQAPAAAGQQPAEEPFTDFESLINFKPMFATYVLKDLWRLYVLPYNRIAPYLIGLLTGHLMYSHLKRRQTGSGAAKPKLTPGAAETTSSTDLLVPSSKAAGSVPADKRNQTDGGPLKLVKMINQHVDLNIWSPIGLLLALIYLPIASQLLEQHRGQSARIGASLIIALMRLVWSLSVARLIYLCFKASLQTTGGGGGEQAPSSGRSLIVNLLSSPKWRPWSKICLSVLLIQWEVIAYLAQVQPIQNLTFSLLLAFVIICIVVSYAIGLLLYLLFEFPLSQIEQLYLSPKLFAKSGKH